MDELSRYNKERWEELAQSNIEYSRPAHNLDLRSARHMVDPEGILDEIAAKDVLCLAAAGGQQSAAFALLGSNVTVLDLSETQLERDRQTAKHYDVTIETVQGDMRDLSRFRGAEFDIIYHAHSINFVPDARQVFREVARVLKRDGLYRLSCSNPFFHGMDEGDWNGEGYLLKLPYDDGTEVIYEDPYWEFDAGDGTTRRVQGPREFRHSLNTLVNGLVEQGFVLRGVWEDLAGDRNAEPGTWEHFKAIAPPYLTFWAVLASLGKSRSPAQIQG